MIIYYPSSYYISYSHRNIYHEDEGEGGQSLSNNNDIQEYNHTSAERRRSDDYDLKTFDIKIDKEDKGSGTIEQYLGV